MPPEGTPAPSAEDKSTVTDAAAAAAVTSTDAKPTDAPSGADLKDAKPPTQEDFRTVVRDALKGSKEKSSVSETTQDKDSGMTGDATDGDKSAPKKGDDATSEADKPPPFHTHPRWISLTKERDTFKGEVDGLKPDAEEFRSIKGFMERNKVTFDQVTDAFQLLALLNSDPTKGREALVKSLADLDARLGETLPEDLTAAVKAGEITEDRAKELSKARATKKIADEALASRDKADQDRQATEDQDRFKAGIRDKVKAWAVVAAKTDPAFAKKQPAINARVASILKARGKLLQSPEDAVEVTRKAYEEENEYLKSFAPPLKASGLVKAEGGGGGGDSPAPKTPLDAVKAGLSRVKG